MPSCANCGDDKPPIRPGQLGPRDPIVLLCADCHPKTATPARAKYGPELAYDVPEKHSIGPTLQAFAAAANRVTGPVDFHPSGKFGQDKRAGQEGTAMTVQRYWISVKEATFLRMQATGGEPRVILERACADIIDGTAKRLRPKRRGGRRLARLVVPSSRRTSADTAARFLARYENPQRGVPK